MQVKHDFEFRNRTLHFVNSNYNFKQFSMSNANFILDLICQL